MYVFKIIHLYFLFTKQVFEDPNKDQEEIEPTPISELWTFLGVSFLGPHGGSQFQQV